MMYHHRGLITIWHPVNTKFHTRPHYLVRKIYKNNPIIRRDSRLLLLLLAAGSSVVCIYLCIGNKDAQIYLMLKR